jgi:single-strand DNA-binding protein
MAGYANITIVGNVGKDPEQKEAKTGPMAKFSVGVSTRRDAETQWYNVTAFGKTAEVVMKYVKKGGSVLISGGLQARTYQDKQGTTKVSLDVDARELVLLGKRDEAVEARSNGSVIEQKPQKFQTPQKPVLDDDLPF